jgi:hypothetical protein
MAREVPVTTVAPIQLDTEVVKACNCGGMITRKKLGAVRLPGSRGPITAYDIRCTNCGHRVMADKYYTERPAPGDEPSYVSEGWERRARQLTKVVAALVAAGGNEVVLTRAEIEAQRGAVVGVYEENSPDLLRIFVENHSNQSAA